MHHRPKHWLERLHAKGADPQGFVFLGHALGQLIDLADKGLAPDGAHIVQTQAATVDWGKAYRDPPKLLTQIARSFDPTLNPEQPSEERAVGLVLRETM